MDPEDIVSMNLQIHKQKGKLNKKSAYKKTGSNK